MTEHAAFLSAIAAEPNNPTHRLVLADWLEEQGDTACAIIRWAHAEGKRPRPSSIIRWAHAEGKRPRPSSGSNGRWWQWYQGESILGIDPASDIPVDIFDCLTSGEFKNGDLQDFRNYETNAAAWLDFLTAARRTGWKPPALKTSQPSPSVPSAASE